MIVCNRTNLGVMTMGGSTSYWTDEMIEGLVEEEILIEKVDDNGLPFNEWLSHKGAFHVPEDYVLKDENGNVINATKIVLEKKKKEYPKTYEECCKILGCKANHFFTNFSYNGLDIEISDYENKIDDLLQTFRKLRYCRDAYWKIAGEEMGLDGPWKPVKPKNNEFVYTITRITNDIACIEDFENCEPFEFPTKEMRDAFYENFKSEIEMCKELL